MDEIYNCPNCHIQPKLMKEMIDRETGEQVMHLECIICYLQPTSCRYNYGQAITDWNQTVINYFVKD